MDTTKTCPSCGKALASNAPAGLCPECLMQAGFPTGTEPPLAGTKHFHFRPPTVEELKPHFPQLEILNFIGQGGMGAVYKARQAMLDRYVALKILPPEAAMGPGFTERFTREARALARLNHPNIVAVHEFGQSGGYHYVIMEFVDGANLREMERAQRLSPAQALSIVPKICEALQYAHDEGVVHRDIKPENILVDKKGRVKIADFGIAKILGAEQPQAPLTGVIGTPHYMAPEQVEKPRTVDHRADIYSVGVVFYEMLTGELPLGRFAAPSKKVQIDVRLDEVVLRTLEKEPEQRYQQASHVKTAVETISSTPFAQNVSGNAKTTNPEEAAVGTAKAWLSLADAGKYSDTWETAGRSMQAALTRDVWVGRMEGARLPLGGVISRKLEQLKLKAISPGLSAGSQAKILFKTQFSELNSATEAVTVALNSAGEWKVIGYLIKPRFGGGIFSRDRWVHSTLWALAALLFLNFILPHTREFNRFGLTQPWIFLPNNAHGTIFNPFSAAFISGLVALVVAIALLNSKRKISGSFRTRTAVGVLSGLATVLLIAALFRVFAVGSYQVDDAVGLGIGRGNRVLVYKWMNLFRSGDLVIYRWFATGYPDKFQVGRVIDIPQRGQITVQHRLEAPITIALSDVVGKVIGNTSPSPSKVDDSQWALFSPVVDPSLGDSSFRLINVLPPRFITLARFELVDERDGTSMLIPELSFYFASGDEPSNVASRITWTLRNIPQNQGACIGQIKGEVGPQVFGNAVTLPTLPRKNSDASIASWRAIHPTRSYWVAPGEWSQRQWNSMPLFEAMDTQGRIIGQMRVQLLVSPLDPETKLPWTMPLFKIGDWRSDSELRSLLGADLPDSPLGHFEIGQRYFPKGDLLELTSIAQVGDRIVAKGRYKLISADRATLTFNVTSTDPRSAHTIVAPEQSVKISKGEGVFELSNSASYSGLPHISMYNAEGWPFASVYFGTKDEADKESRLQLSHELRSPELEQLPPVVVETMPASGSDDVEPGETDIQVRFSKDMEDRSWSWSTAWDDSNPEAIGEPHYSDARTCHLKVKLEPGHAYAYWLNSEKFGNFKDAEGAPAIPYLLIFKTKTK